MNTKIVILIVSPPGDLQIGLQALLTTHMDADVLVTGKVSSALQVIERYKPVLVILDQDIQKENAPRIIQEIKMRWPEIRCVVLVNDEKRQGGFVDAGAEIIITKGFPGSKLIDEIKKVIKEENK